MAPTSRRTNELKTETKSLCKKRRPKQIRKYMVNVMKSKSKKLMSAIAASALVGAILIAPAQAAFAKSWSFSEDSVSLGLKGVSPHVQKTSKGDRLWRSDMVPTGTAVTICDSNGNCTQETFSTGSAGPVSDYTIAKAKSGWRAYFKSTDTSSQKIMSAPCTTEDCLSFGTPVLTSTEMVVAKDQKAWGVPDAVTLTDGRVRIYIVESDMSQKTSCPENIASYISSDGISFKKESGWRLTGGYVDSEVLSTAKNKWVMIVADGPGCGSSKGSMKPQQLFITTSKNGLKWAKPKVLTKTDVGRLDPTGYKVKGNTYRIYYAEGSFADNNYTIKRATLRLK